MKPVKVAEGVYDPYMFEHHYFRLYLAESGDDVAELEGIDNRLVEYVKHIESLRYGLYAVHFVQDSSG